MPGVSMSSASLREAPIAPRGACAVGFRNVLNRPLIRVAMPRLLGSLPFGSQAVESDRRPGGQVCSKYSAEAAEASRVQDH